MRTIGNIAKSVLFAAAVSGCFYMPKSDLYAPGYTAQNETRLDFNQDRKAESNPNYRALVSVFPNQEKYNQKSEEDIMDNLTWSVKLAVLF